MASDVGLVVVSSSIHRQMQLYPDSTLSVSTMLLDPPLAFTKALEASSIEFHNKAHAGSRTLRLMSNYLRLFVIFRLV